MKNTRDVAIEMSAGYAKHARTGNLLEGRISKLENFLSENQNVELRKNNTWGKAPGKYTNAVLIGGTTYQYMIWAVSV